MLLTVQEAAACGGTPVIGRDQGALSTKNREDISAALASEDRMVAMREHELSIVGNYDPALFKPKSGSATNLPHPTHTSHFFSLAPLTSVNLGKSITKLVDPFFATRRVAYSLDHLDVQACRGDPNLLCFNSTFHHLGSLHYLAKTRGILGHSVLFLVDHKHGRYDKFVDQDEWERRLKKAKMDENTVPVEKYRTGYVKTELRHQKLSPGQDGDESAGSIQVRIGDRRHTYKVETGHQGSRYFQPKAVMVYDPNDKNFVKNYAGLDQIHNQEAIGPNKKTSKFAHCPYCSMAAQNHMTVTSHICSAHYRLAFLCRRCKGGPYFSANSFTDHVGSKSCDHPGEAGRRPAIESRKGNTSFDGPYSQCPPFTQDFTKPAEVDGLPDDGYGNVVTIGKGYFPEDA